MRATVASPSIWGFVKARDTLARETPAVSATCEMVGLARGIGVSSKGCPLFRRLRRGDDVAVCRIRIYAAAAARVKRWEA